MRILSKLLPNSRRESSAKLAQHQLESPAPSCDRGAPAQARANTKALVDCGQFGEALAVIDAQLQACPGDGELLLLRASTLFAWGRYTEAHRCFIQAIAAGVEGFEVHAKLGWTCLWLGRKDEAIDALRHATDIAPDDWSTHFGLATALRAAKRTDESKSAFERALALSPDSIACLSRLTACEIEAGNFGTAERLALRLVDLAPESPAAFADLGMVLSSQDRHGEAIAAFERAEALDTPSTPLGADGALNYAIGLLRAGRTSQALALLERRIPQCPSVGLHSQYALALLIAGRFAQGWQQYEFRWMDEPLLAARPNFIKPQWAGQDLEGKAILLWSEQGFGDFIQFIRYANLLKERGAKVIAFVRQDLVELAKGLPSIDHVLGPNEPYPTFDYYINLLSIPRVLGTDIESIPADVPYVVPKCDRRAAWLEKLGGGPALKVGIVWAGSSAHLRNRFRSLTLEHLAPLLGVPGVRFFSLQKGPAAIALKSAAGANCIIDLGPDLLNFAETAAVIDCLDLVIAVDTAVSHLAGALAKPVWMLIPHPCDWRWMEHREDTPWYPTMRIFRQRVHGDWHEPVERVRTALEAAVQSGASALSGNPPRGAIIRRSSPSPRHVEPERIQVSRVAETRLGIMQYFPDDDVGRSIEFYGEFRQRQLEWLSRLVAPAATVLHINSGIGVETLWLSRRVGPQGHVFVYEDRPAHRLALEQNLKANRVTNATVMQRRVRISNIDDYLSAPGDSGGSALNVSTDRFDDTIDELHLEQLDFLMIGRGDRALHVLEGTAETLWRLRPRLFIDIGSEQELERLSGRITDFGYACWRSEIPEFNPGNFNRRKSESFAGSSTTALIALPEETVLDVPLDGCRRLA